MFDIGVPELIVVFIVALLVFGPKRLPELGRALGKGINELRRAFYEIKAEMDTELSERDREEKYKEKRPVEPAEKPGEQIDASGIANRQEGKE